MHWCAIHFPTAFVTRLLASLQNVDDLLVSLLPGVIIRSVTPHVDRRSVSPCLQQQSRDLCVAAERCKVQGRPPVGICGVGIGGEFEQQPRHCRVAVARRIVQGSPHVVALVPRPHACTSHQQPPKLPCVPLLSCLDQPAALLFLRKAPQGRDTIVFSLWYCLGSHGWGSCGSRLAAAVVAVCLSGCGG